jgi:hypothetical protein
MWDVVVGSIGSLGRVYQAPMRLVGLDFYQPSLDFCEQHKFYDELLRLDLRELPLRFKDKEFECEPALRSSSIYPWVLEKTFLVN